MTYTFGDFELDETLYQLRRSGDLVKIEPKVFDVLAYLVNQRDRVVTKDELLGKLWHGEFVSEWVLPRCIAAARKALGDHDSGQRTIQTVHGRGYRFVATVSEPAAVTAHESAPVAADGGRASEAEDAEDGAAGVFVGRIAIMTELRAALDESFAGRGRLVLLVGEPGIGKTRTATEIGRIARRRGASVLTGRCYEGEGAPAFWPWVQVMRACLGRRELAALADDLVPAATGLAQLVPELRDRGADPAALAPDQARFRLFDDAARFLRAVTERHPLVIVLDDLHWADKSSLLMLQFLAREIADARMLVLGTYRDVALDRRHALAQVLGDLAREPHYRRLPLRGLGEDDVAEFVTATAGRAAASTLVRALHEMTEGNPFFIAETVRLLLRDGAIDDDAALATLRLPEGIRAAIGRRLDTLSEECNAVLTIAAAIARDFAVPVLERLVDTPRGRLLETLDEAVAARIVREAAPGHYRFAHGLIRETLYEELPTPKRVRLHCRIAQVLEQVHAANPGPHLAEIAHHHFQGAAGGDVLAAVAACERAAERALELLAYDEAVVHHRHALDALELLGPIDEAERVTILLRLGDAQSCAGERENSRATFRLAADGARAAGRPDLFARAALGFGGRAEFGARHDPDLVSLLEEARAGLGAGDDALRAQLLSRLVGTAPYSDSLATRRALSAEAVALARSIDDATALTAALNARYWALLGPDHVDERLAVGTELVALADRTRDRYAAFMAHEACFNTLLALGDMSAADRELEVLAVLAEELRLPVARWFVAWFRASGALSAGRFDEAERLIAEGRALGARAQHPEAVALFAGQMLVLAHERGRAEDFAREWQLLLEHYPLEPPMERIGIALAYSELGREADARREFEILAAEDFAGLPRNEHWLLGIAQVAAVCAFLGDPRRAAVLYDLLLPFAELNAVHDLLRVTAGAVSHYLAMLAVTMEKWNEAARWFEHALVANARMGVRPFLVRTQYEYARLLLARNGRSEQRSRARALLTEAAGAAEEMGLTRVLPEVLELKRQAEQAPSRRRAPRS